MIYAKWLNGRWLWRWTLDARVDEVYMADAISSSEDTHDPPHLVILLLKPALSIGQAFTLCSELQRHIQPYPPPVQTASNEATLKVSSDEYFIAPSDISDPMLTSIRRTALRLDIPKATVERMQLYFKNRYTPSVSSSGLQLCEQEYKKLIQALRGRSLLYEELLSLLKEIGLSSVSSQINGYLQLAALRGHVKLVNGHENIDKHMRWLRLLGLASKQVWRCRRCGSEGSNALDSGTRTHETGSMSSAHCANCETDCLYCEKCLTMGRTRYCSLLVIGMSVSVLNQVDPVYFSKENTPETMLETYIAPWGLTNAQAAASLAGLRFISNPLKESNQSSAFLIWAVTGAGKTEMLFPLIAYRLSLGGKVLLAAPRKDVVMELNSRIIKAFPDYSVSAIYGGSEDKWREADITIATTHQLLRFQGKFDLVIMDEVDAFPYHNNPMLQFAAHKSRRPNGHILLVTATPPIQLQQEARRKRLAYATVPARYHMHPLPVPLRLTSPSMKQIAARQSLPAVFRRHLQTSIERGAQIFIFLPHIAAVSQIVTLLRRELAYRFQDPLSIQGTSSQDLHRTEKVQQFREGIISVLVTTTILERGITVPKTDVFVLDANASLFDEAALVQMSGRAGRSQADPKGLVYFLSSEWTSSQKGAIRHIEQMNKLARKRGLLQ